MQELWFLCMTGLLNVLYKCMKFLIEISVTVIILWSGQDFVKDTQTDRPTDRQTQGEKQYVSRPLQGGDIIINQLKSTILTPYPEYLNPPVCVCGGGGGGGGCVVTNDFPYEKRKGAKCTSNMQIRSSVFIAYYMRGNWYANSKQSVINTLQAKRFQYAYCKRQIKHNYYA